MLFTISTFVDFNRITARIIDKNWLINPPATKIFDFDSSGGKKYC